MWTNNSDDVRVQRKLSYLNLQYTPLACAGQLESAKCGVIAVSRFGLAALRAEVFAWVLRRRGCLWIGNRVIISLESG
jgi:hypothetical protein